MKYFHKQFLLSAAMMLAIAPLSVAAQEPQFAPVMAEFSGKGALLLPPMPALDINGSGTIELWMAAKWDADPGYDPGLLSYAGAQGPRFAVVVTADRQALGVYAGKNYATVPFDFSDAALHHLALISIGDTVSIMVDGEQLATLDYGFVNLPADNFSIGALGKFSPFIGDIGQVRIWDEPIDPDVLIDFSWREIAADGPNAHPDIDALVGVSAFGNPETGGFIFVGSPDDADIGAANNAPIDDSEIGLTDQP